MVLEWVTYTITWWLPNGVLYIIVKYDLFSNYKINPAPVNKDLVRAALIDNVISHNILHPLINIALYKYLWQGVEKEYFIQLPSVQTFFFHMAVGWFWADGSFYFTHRFLHWGKIYGFIHKQHHEFKKTVGVASTYAHIVEGLISNFGSTFLWVFYFRPHAFTLILFLALRYEETVEEHSGYMIPISPWCLLRDNSHHDFHHSHNIGAYGTFPFWDWMLGTDKNYYGWMDEYMARFRKGGVAAAASGDILKVD